MRKSQPALFIYAYGFWYFDKVEDGIPLYIKAETVYT